MSDVVELVIFFAGGAGVGMLTGVVIVAALAVKYQLEGRHAARCPLSPLVPLEPLRHERDRGVSSESTGC